MWYDHFDDNVFDSFFDVCNLMIFTIKCTGGIMIVILSLISHGQDVALDSPDDCSKLIM